MSEIIVTILTATYNRCNTLPMLYQSLCMQTDKSFQWLIIDDGSCDDTEKYINSIPDSGFRIDYKKKKNGGKHTALNYSHPFIIGELVFFVDSDDSLEEDAVESIITQWTKYHNCADIGVLSFRKKTVSGKNLSSTVVEPLIQDDITYRVNNRISGDRSEVIRTDLFLRYPFPEFSGERFMGEGWLFRHIAYDYKTVYLNRTIYVCDYLDGGLSKSGRLLRMKCPYGMMENSKSFFVPQVSTAVQIKQAIAFGIYGLCAGLSMRDIANRSGRPWRQIALMPISLAVYHYWCNKYDFKG